MRTTGISLSNFGDPPSQLNSRGFAAFDVTATLVGSRYCSADVENVRTSCAVGLPTSATSPANATADPIWSSVAPDADVSFDSCGQFPKASRRNR